MRRGGCQRLAHGNRGIVGVDAGQHRNDRRDDELFAVGKLRIIKEAFDFQLLTDNGSRCPLTADIADASGNRIGRPRMLMTGQQRKAAFLGFTKSVVLAEIFENCRSGALGDIDGTVIGVVEVVRPCGTSNVRAVVIQGCALSCAQVFPQRLPAIM